MIFFLSRITGKLIHFNFLVRGWQRSRFISQKSNDGTGIKNDTFFKSIVVADNGVKKVPRYSTMVLLYLGTAQHCK